MWTITGIIIKQINQKIISQLPMLMRRLPPSPGFSFPTVASNAFSWSWVSVTVPALISDDGRPVLALLLRWFSLSSSRFCILYCSRFFLMKSLDGFLGFCAGSSMYSGSGLRIVWRSSLVLYPYWGNQNGWVWKLCKCSIHPQKGVWSHWGLTGDTDKQARVYS